MRRRVVDMMSIRTKSGESHLKPLKNTTIDRSNVVETMEETTPFSDRVVSGPLPSVVISCLRQ